MRGWRARREMEAEMSEKRRGQAIPQQLAGRQRQRIEGEKWRRSNTEAYGGPRGPEGGRWAELITMSRHTGDTRVIFRPAMRSSERANIYNQQYFPTMSWFCRFCSFFKARTCWQRHWTGSHSNTKRSCHSELKPVTMTYCAAVYKLNIVERKINKREDKMLLSRMWGFVGV